MVLYCSDCGNQITPRDRYCRYCGFKLTEEHPIKLKCPECSKFIKEDSCVCENCGFRLSNNDLNYVIKESNTKSCPKCSNKNNIDAEFCGNCGETLQLVSNLDLIKCPECNMLAREDVNFCRFCGHNFITNKIPIFKKKFRPFETYCQNCGKKFSNIKTINYCPDCGTLIPPYSDIYAATTLSHEKYQLTFINKFIVPLSKHYNENFRKTHLRQYFDISKKQESHIIFLIMNDLINDNSNVNVIDNFKKYLEETINLENPKKEILTYISSILKDAFNNEGISISDISTIEGSYYKTIETPVIQDKHGGLTKGVATLGFGIVGLAATSGVKQTTSTKKVLKKGKYIHRKITIKDKYIVLKTYQDNSSNTQFNFSSDNITKIVFNWEDIHSFDDEHYFIFNTGETLKCPTPDTTEWISMGVMKILGTTNLEYNRNLNKEWKRKLEDDVTKIFFDMIQDKINEYNKISNNEKIVNNIDVDELEKIIKMYQEGLLNDEEFATMKQNLIGIKQIDDNPNNDTTDDTRKFCGNCGSKIIKNSKFCTQCGTQL